MSNTHLINERNGVCQLHVKNKFLLATLLGLQLTAASAADTDAGKATFAARCASCHAVGPSARGAFAPQLNGIVGRRAASTTDFRYSNAMKNSGIVWSEKNLAAFLRGPGDVVPGTSMRFWGLGNEQQIANLLAYLRTVK
jgi:cytochrome c